MCGSEPGRGTAGLITVEDEGPGVPGELHEAVFEPFRQGPSPSSHSPGAGVGLALVARFAELHEGWAWVEDRQGSGASFHVFPPAPPREYLDAGAPTRTGLDRSRADRSAPLGACEPICDARSCRFDHPDVPHVACVTVQNSDPLLTEAIRGPPGVGWS